MGLYTILSPASTKHHGSFARTRLQLHTRQFEVIIPLPHRLLVGRVYFKNDSRPWTHADDSTVGGRAEDPSGSGNVSCIKPRRFLFLDPDAFVVRLGQSCGDI